MLSVLATVKVLGDSSFHNGLSICFSATSVTNLSCVSAEPPNLFNILIRIREPPLTSTVSATNDAGL